jgi:outer membrane protein
MKLILSFLLLAITLFAEDLVPKKQDVTLGLGAYVQTQPYKGADTLLLPSPVVFFDNGLFYMRWSRGGVYFYGDRGDDYAWGFSLTAQPRVYGYKPSDSPFLATLKEKKNTLEGGLAFSAKKMMLTLKSCFLLMF